MLTKNLQLFVNMSTINRLKTLMLKLFKVDIEKSGPDFVLYMKSDKDAPPTILDDEEDTLGNFGVAENCEIFINEVDSRVKEKERLRKMRKNLILTSPLSRSTCRRCGCCSLIMRQPSRSPLARQHRR